MTFVKTYWKHAVAVLLFIVYSVFGYHQVFDVGFKDGVDRVFRYCHDEGGILINSETGERIGCAPLVVQRQQPLDKGEEKWYNNS